MKIYVEKTDGTYGELKELPEDYTFKYQNDFGTLYEDEWPNVALSGDIEILLHLNREIRKAWAIIFQMQRYKATEWIFPRKKKRGTARRRRKEGRR